MVKPDALATVHQYINDFNKGDKEAMATTFAVPASILDGMAPHVWQGSTASEDWYRDVLIEGEKAGAADYHLTLGEPRHAEITGDNAYVVVPMTMTFTVRGKQVTQTGAVFTVALRRVEGEWRLTAWAWAKGSSQ